jgi:predicted RNA binding protein YcfA (HicA-like mRNA interferase family)
MIFFSTLKWNIRFKEGRRIVIPVHAGKNLHPKIVKQVLKFLEDAE